MTLVIRAVLFVWLALCSGCAAQQIDHVLSNLDKDCERHYMINVGGMGLTSNASATIDCKASGTTTTTTVTVVPANPASVPSQ